MTDWDDDYCDDYDYEDEEYYPRNDWADIYIKVVNDGDRVLSSFDKEPSRYPPIMWWARLDDVWPDGGITIRREDYDYDNSYSHRSFITGGGEIYLDWELSSPYGYPDYFDSCRSGRVVSHRIWGYEVKDIETKPYLSGVLATDPPPWGWWMPTLQEVNL